MKKIIVVFALVLLTATGAFATSDIVYMALQVQDGGEQNPDYYSIIKGATTINVPASIGFVQATSGGWNLVVFPLSTFRTYACQWLDIPEEDFTILETADWLSGADGWLSWDQEGMYDGERLNAPIQNRAFGYSDVLDVLIQKEWWVKDGDEFTKYTGTRAQWDAAGNPKLFRTRPAPARYQ